jgi:hypothetical protein
MRPFRCAYPRLHLVELVDGDDGFLNGASRLLKQNRVCLRAREARRGDGGTQTTQPSGKIEQGPTASLASTATPAT